jgi:hypothetical protein
MGKGAEMIQTFYAHMNKRKKIGNNQNSLFPSILFCAVVAMAKRCLQN